MPLFEKDLVTFEYRADAFSTLFVAPKVTSSMTRKHTPSLDWVASVLPLKPVIEVGHDCDEGVLPSSGHCIKVVRVTAGTPPDQPLREVGQRCEFRGRQAGWRPSLLP